MNNKENLREDTNIELPQSTDESRVTWYTKLYGKGVLLSFLLTSIAMTIGIVTVCLATPKLSKSCQSSFQALIDDKLIRQNSNPCSIAAGDFNHDNLLDLAVANSGTNTIGIFLNNENDTFAPQMTLTTGDSSRPLSVVVGDFNNDTHLDIAVANYDTHNIGIFLGYGNGNFSTQMTFSTGVSRPVSLAVGDLNNDHRLDIVVANNGTDSISIVFGYGDGSFVNQITYSTSYDSRPCSVLVADLNNDRHLDIAVANHGTDNVGIFLGYGDGRFRTQIVYSTHLYSKPYSIAVNDFNHDGHLDIAIANSGTNDVSILFGDGNGSFILQRTYSISPGSNPHSIGIGDFNQDNQSDIAVSNYDTNNVNILIGYGNGSFAKPTMLSTGIASGPFGMTVSDFDNDNRSDIAVVNSVTSNVFVLIGYYMMQSEYPPAYSTGVGSIPRQIASGDLNNDTEIDLIVANSGTNKIGIFFGYGNGSFQEQVTYSTGDNSHPYALTVSDIDNDHQLDIVVADTKTQSVGILYGYGDGTFTTIITYFTGNSSSPRWVIASDCNNDNHLDLIFADYGTDSIGILLGYGNRTFGSPMRYLSGVGSHPFSIATGDFNNDSRLDIAAACFGTDSIVVFLGSGNGIFTLFVTYPTGDGSLPCMLTVVDLNHDNYLDIVVANSGTNDVGVLFGFGNGTFATQLTYSTGSNSALLSATLADLNNDYCLDLAVVNSNGNNVGVFLGNGSGYFGIQTTYSTGINSQPYSIVVGDFNKDNRLDIAVTNSGAANVAILLAHPTEASVYQTAEITYMSSKDAPILLGDYYPNFHNQTTYSTGSSSAPFSIAVGDLNNDKYMDIIVANSGNANLGILLGYGNGTFMNEAIYSLDSGAHPQNVVVGDLNRDDLLDVAVMDPKNDRIIVLLGDGSGTFSTEMIYSTGSGSNPNALAIGNLNNDHYLDLVVACMGTDTIGIFFGFDYTLFARENSFEAGGSSSPTLVVIGDFNNDGHLDIVCTLYATTNVGIFLGYGNGTFTPVMTFAYVSASDSWSVAVGDFNNDNQLDITVANWGIDSISVVLGYGNGSFADPILFSTGFGTRPVSVAVDDFNNDHYLDITTGNYGGDSITVFLGYGNGTFQSIILLSTGTGSSTSSITVADVNNDSRLDIIVANYGTNNVGIFLGYGNGSFAEQMIFSTGANSAPWSAVAGDFNKDGQLDLAVANYGTSNVGVLYGYGNGTFGYLQIYSTGIGSKPTNVQVADFNNDNQLDIIVGDETLDRVGVFFGYSDGTFTSISSVSIEQGSCTYGVAVGDFNKDNHLDFAFSDTCNNNIGVLLSFGSEPFSGQTTVFIDEGSRPSFVAVGYFNNDNQLDIAVANSGTDNIGVLFGLGNRLFSNMTTYSTGGGSHPMSLVVGDFNDDSLTDIAVANSEINKIIVFVGYGNGSFFSFITYSMGEGCQPVSITVGDFNKDNRSDIAVANFGMNNVCVLFSYGNGTFTNETWYPLGYDSRPSWVAAKDLNNDSRDDIAVANYGNDNVNILLNIC